MTSWVFFLMTVDVTTATHVRWDVLVFIKTEWNRDELLKTLFHPLFITDSIVAQDEVEAGFCVGTLTHDVLKMYYGFRVLANADKNQADVLHDLHLQLFESVGDLIQCLLVQLDGFHVILLLHIDVGHTDIKTPWRGSTYRRRSGKTTDKVQLTDPYHCR